MNLVVFNIENQCDYDMAIDHLKENEKFVYFSISMLRIQLDIRKILYVANQFCDVIKRYHIDLVHTHSQSLCIIAEIVKIKMKVSYIRTNHIDVIARVIL